MSYLPKHLLGLSKSQLEDLCIRCGLCCYFSVSIDKSNGSVLIPDLRCKYLSFNKSGESCCNIYEKRHQITDWCLPLVEAIKKGIFPEQCPYVSDVKNYVGSVVLSNDAYKLIELELKKNIIKNGKPNWASDENWNEFIKEF